MILFRFDPASYADLRQLLTDVDRATTDLRPAWDEAVGKYRRRAPTVYAHAQAKAPRRISKRYARAKRGGEPLVVTGTARDALTRPDFVDLRPLELVMGVETRNVVTGRGGGGWFNDLTYLEVLTSRFGVFRKLNATETRDWSRAVVERIEQILRGGPR